MNKINSEMIMFLQNQMTPKISSEITLFNYHYYLQES